MGRHMISRLSLVTVLLLSTGTPALPDGPNSALMDPMVIPMPATTSGKTAEPAPSSDVIFFEAPSQYQMLETQSAAASTSDAETSSDVIFFEAPPQPAVIPFQTSRARDLVPLGLFLALTVICLCR